MVNKRSKFWIVCSGILAAAVLALIFGAAVTLLWNALLPALFGITKINYWQAVGLLVLMRLLFGGASGMNRIMHGMGDRRDGRQNPFREKWLAMTDEERQNFLAYHHHIHHVFDGSDDEAKTGGIQKDSNAKT